MAGLSLRQLEVVRSICLHPMHPNQTAWRHLHLQHMQHMQRLLHGTRAGLRVTKTRVSLSTGHVTLAEVKFLPVLLLAKWGV